MSEYGFYYQPEACKTKSCKVHMYIHGCSGSWENYNWNEQTGQGYISTLEDFQNGNYGNIAHMKWSWWIEMADAHEINVIFPMLSGRYNKPEGQFDFGGSYGSNLDYGCWDVWNGYLDKESFRTNKNKQLRVLKEMLDFSINE